MLNQVNESIKKASRLMTLRHPNAVDVAVYRKVFTRDDGDNNDAIRTLGGALFLANEDEADYEVELLGAGKMLFLGRVAGTDFAGEGLNFNDEEINAYIEPIIQDEFEVKKEDRIFWILPNFIKEYQVKGIGSPSQFPNSRLAVYRLQPIEQSTLDLPGGAV